jgi:hypothetical protein
MKMFFMLLVLALHPLAGHAEMFRCMDASGNVTYSLTKPAGPCHAQRKAAKAKRKVAKSPEGFPRVDPVTQLARDDKRRQILESELETEKQLHQAAEEAEEAARHQRNINALRHELAYLR